MARPKTVRAPTTASLPNNLRIPSTTPSLVKTLGKLSRQALLDLALLWLDDRNLAAFPPYLQHEEADGPNDQETLPYPAAETVEEVRQAYEDYQERKGGKREVLEHILEGDWRHGITLRQLAMADLRYMDDHPASLRWTALELTRTRRLVWMRSAHASGDFCESSPAGNLSSCQGALSPRSLSRSTPDISSNLGRGLAISSSPTTPETFTDSSRVIYVAFPDSCPFIYTSIAASTGSKPAVSTNAAGTDPRSLQRLVREAIPKALSRPQERYTLKPTSLAAKNLPTLLKLRGPGRTTVANGAFSIFADAVVEGSPLDPRPSNTVTPEEHLHGSHKISGGAEDKENAKHQDDPQSSTNSTTKRPPIGDDDSVPLSPASKKRRLAIHSRFGTSGSALAPAPLDRLDIRLLDTPGSRDDSDDEGGGTADHAAATAPSVSLTFAGSDIIAGFRKLAELGVVDPERMPSWMTGEEAVSVAVVRQGRRLRKDV
ncbi:hypothetical protein NUU61_009755 [Penicillium alfredii]|uniref:CHL4 family chromosome segregation protein n=1 Tax=Penicillium alfredii TaxID=1506179 RepID=A0A9W9EGT8_9EURO|nr:uncharacterized protein NUU61_009755 [Penicillium alfredii]KAJ5081491.1 hypothetical protein NUU61_009755 [Penicillium alfredii]